LPVLDRSSDSMPLAVFTNCGIAAAQTPAIPAASAGVAGRISNPIPRP
jgi:hypothetical protein